MSKKENFWSWLWGYIAVAVIVLVFVTTLYLATGWVISVAWNNSIKTLFHANGMSLKEGFFGIVLFTLFIIITKIAISTKTK